MLEFIKKTVKKIKVFFENTEKLKQAKACSQHLLTYVIEQESRIWEMSANREQAYLQTLLASINPTEIKEGSAKTVDHFQSNSTKYLLEVLKERRLVSLK